jgi:hydroxyethylthiazole kinase-like uncharacterized protein yjeF
MRAPIATASQVRALDAYTIQTLGVPSLALMETAGRAVVDVARARLGAALNEGVWVVCGRGNNGGDGYVIARTLRLLGVPVSVWGLGGAHSPDGGVMRLAAEAVGVPVIEAESAPWSRPPGLIIDALLGSGVDRPLEGAARARVEAMNRAGCPILAVDLPSGLCGDTGRALGLAVNASITVTFGWEKLGLVLEPGADHAGEVIVADIGLTTLGQAPPPWPLTRLNGRGGRVAPAVSGGGLPQDEPRAPRRRRGQRRARGGGGLGLHRGDPLGLRAGEPVHRPRGHPAPRRLAPRGDAAPRSAVVERAGGV